MLKFSLRAAEPQDHASTRKLVDDAFRPEDVVTFLDALRADGCILGEWLAEDGTGPIGHIVFSRVWIERPDGIRDNAVMLTPLAVCPDRQRIGVGLELMNYALRTLEARGETLFFVLGHPAYYPRAGFLSSRAAEIESPWRGKPYFMLRANGVPKGRLHMPLVIVEAHRED